MFFVGLVGTYYARRYKYIQNLCELRRKLNLRRRKLMEARIIEIYLRGLPSKLNKGISVYSKYELKLTKILIYRYAWKFKKVSNLITKIGLLYISTVKSKES